MAEVNGVSGYKTVTKAEFQTAVKLEQVNADGTTSIFYYIQEDDGQAISQLTEDEYNLFSKIFGFKPASTDEAAKQAAKEQAEEPDVYDKLNASAGNMQGEVQELGQQVDNLANTSAEAKKLLDTFVANVEADTAARATEQVAEEAVAQEPTIADEIAEYDAIIAKFNNNEELTDEERYRRYELSEKFGFISPDVAVPDEDADAVKAYNDILHQYYEDKITAEQGSDELGVTQKDPAEIIGILSELNQIAKSYDRKLPVELLIAEETEETVAEAKEPTVEDEFAEYNALAFNDDISVEDKNRAIEIAEKYGFASPGAALSEESKRVINHYNSLILKHHKGEELDEQEVAYLNSVDRGYACVELPFELREAQEPTVEDEFAEYNALAFNDDISVEDKNRAIEIAEKYGFASPGAALSEESKRVINHYNELMLKYHKGEGLEKNEVAYLNSVDIGYACVELPFELREAVEEPVEAAKPAETAEAAKPEVSEAKQETEAVEAEQEGKSLLKEAYEKGAAVVESVKEFTGWNDIVRSQDRKDERTELWMKETKGAMYIPAAAGNFAAQATDVNSRASERVTELTEEVDNAVNGVSESAKGNKTAEAGADALKGIASGIKIINGVLNLNGGVSDEVSSALKLEDYTNNMIMDSTKKSLGVIADNHKDYSDANFNDRKTVIDVATRLGIAPEELENMEPEQVRELIKNEADIMNPTGVIHREAVLRTANNAAADQLIDKNSKLMINQKDEGLIKLDKGQQQLREGASELLNLPAAAVDLVNEGVIASGLDALGAGETVKGIATAPLNIVTGLTQTITTSFDGKEGSTKKAVNKFLSGVTFGFLGKDEEEPEADEAKGQPVVTDIEPGESERPLTREEFDAKNKAELKAEYETKKDEAMHSDEAITNRAYYLIDAKNAGTRQRYLQDIEAARNSNNEELASKLEGELQQIEMESALNYQKEVDELKATLAQTMDARTNYAEAEAKKLIEEGKIDERDAARLAQMDENSRMATFAFWASMWNDLDGSYSNADNTAGDRGFVKNALSVGKGFFISPLRAVVTEPVTTADKVLGIIPCNEIAGPIILGYTAAKKLGEGVEEIYHSHQTYNTALKKEGYEKSGEALAYLAATLGLSVTAALPDSHCWHFRPHGQNWHFGCGHDHVTPAPTPSFDEIFLNDPSALFKVILP